MKHVLIVATLILVVTVTAVGILVGGRPPEPELAARDGRPDARAYLEVPAAEAAVVQAEVEVAGKSPSAQTLGERFTDPAYPVGRAFNFYGCRAAFCADSCAP